MHVIDWLVIVAALGVAAWVNWYFFLVEREGARATRRTGRSS